MYEMYIYIYKSFKCSEVMMFAPVKSGVDLCVSASGILSANLAVSGKGFEIKGSVVVSCRIMEKEEASELSDKRLKGIQMALV